VTSLPVREVAFRDNVGVLLSALLSLWLAVPAAAQVNIEAQRRAPSDLGLSGTVAADLLLKTGNVEHFRVGVGGRVDYQTASTSTFLVGKGNLGLVGSNRFSNAGLVHLRHGRHWLPRLMPEAYAQVNYDEPRLLEFRAVAGGGMRVTLTDGESVGLWLGTGYMFEHERLDLPDTAIHPRTTSAHRWSSYVSGRVSAGDNLTFLATGYAQPQFDDFADFRILCEMSLGVSVTRALALTVGFSLRYDSRPPDDVVSLDTELRNGVAVVF
jgi:hypothetical protein